MSLHVGVRLGPYEVLERVGAGGMGEVYRARDTRLDRSVAVKLLPEELAADAGFRGRFDREAKVISSLQHPNICVLHDVGRENGLDYLVMELCEGPTLAQRIARGPLPVEQVLRHGMEIAEALSAAHGAGIVHRDLKPSNVMLTRSGVKLLDFGLAKYEPGVRSESGTTTIDRRLSDDGRILGTLPYTAPEILLGREATPRSDIFALGLVLYEMLTGKRAFEGMNRAALTAAILEHEPTPPAELRDGVPAALGHVIEKCLAKSPEERWESAHDIAEELRWIRQSKPVVTPAGRTRRTAVAALAVAAAAAAVVIVVWGLSRRPAASLAVRLSIPLAQSMDQPSNVEGYGFGLPNVAISPDGKRIAFVGMKGNVSQIYLRQLDSFDTVPIAGTETGAGPFFSPDGQSLGFVIRGSLMELSLAGGPPRTLSPRIALGGRGATWAANGMIYFSPFADGGLWTVSANGANAHRITKPNWSAGENSHRWPEVLPDGKHLLFTIRTNDIPTFDDARIAVLSLETGTWKVVLDGGTCARYVSGDLLFGRAGSLYAVPFDLASLMVTGPRRKVIDGVVTRPSSGAADYAVSSNNTVVYVPGTVSNGRTEIVALDAAGHASPVANLSLTVNALRLSPDGRKMALAVAAANDGIWLYDVGSGAVTRVSFERGNVGAPVWTADGSRLIYHAASLFGLTMREIGGGEPEVLLRSPNAFPMSCSPDGKLLVYDDKSPETGGDLWLLPLSGDRTPRPLLRSRFNESEAWFSPDGQWIAYTSNETSSYEIYVRPATPAGQRWQISTDGGRQPRWSPDGKTVFYRHGDGVFGVPISVAGNAIRSGKPAVSFSMPRVADFDVTPTGFVIARNSADAPAARQLNVIVNWKP